MNIQERLAYEAGKRWARMTEAIRRGFEEGQRLTLPDTIAKRMAERYPWKCQQGHEWSTHQRKCFACGEEMVPT